MKRISVYFMLLLTLTMTTSCSSDEDDGAVVIIEPDDLPMFDIDADGIPFRYGTPYLSQEMQNAFRNEAVGYGWRWMQSNEIMTGGKVKNEDAYAGIYGMSPSSYYIESETSVIRYFYSDVVPASAFLQSEYTMDVNTGMMNNSKNVQILPWNIFLRVWTIYKLSGKWYMSCVEPLCTRITDDGQSCVVWATSQYVRMTDAELREMQKQHTFDYSIVN